MPDQLFDVVADPGERVNLAERGDTAATLRKLGGMMDDVCDLQATDGRAKEAQRARAEEFRGSAGLAQAAHILWSPPPGAQVKDSQFSR